MFLNRQAVKCHVLVRVGVWVERGQWGATLVTDITFGEAFLEKDIVSHPFFKVWLSSLINNVKSTDKISQRASKN